MVITELDLQTQNAILATAKHPTTNLAMIGDVYLVLLKQGYDQEIILSELFKLADNKIIMWTERNELLLLNKIIIQEQILVRKF